MDKLGKLKMEYERDGNVVQVYNAPTVCSLVINGEVVDEYRGLVAGRFVLEGQIECEGEEPIPVEAKMGFLFMSLFYGNVLVGKKFMGFG